MSDVKLKISRAIMQLQVEQTTTVPLGAVSFTEAETMANKFARGRRIGIECRKVETGIAIKKVEFVDYAAQYAGINELDIGQSLLIKLPPAFHHRVRLAASNQNRLKGWALSCTREGDAIRVTRLPAAGDSPDVEIQVPPRQTKYGLDRLSTGEKIKFDLPRAEHHKVRMAVSAKARMTGWRIRCRVQDDGTMLVYRADLPAA